MVRALTSTRCALGALARETVRSTAVKARWPAPRVRRERSPLFGGRHTWLSLKVGRWWQSRMCRLFYTTVRTYSTVPGSTVAACHVAVCHRGGISIRKGEKNLPLKISQPQARPHGARDHSRRPQSFAASGSSVVSASHSIEAEEDSRQSSASSLRSPAVCSTSAYASREAATAGKHACGRHLESSGEPRAASWPGWENPARLLLSVSTRFSVRPPLGRPQQPGAPPEHRLAPDAAKHGLPRATASRKPPAPRPASGDGRACSGGPGLDGLLFRHTEARHCRGVEGDIGEI